MAGGVNTPHQDYTIITTATKSPAREGWLATVEIVDRDAQQVVAPLDLREALFATEELAHRAAVVLARHWIDGPTPV